MKTIYIAGPIFSIPEEERKAAFDRAKIVIRSFDASPLSPLDIAPSSHEGECPVGRQGAMWEGAYHTDTCYLHADLIGLLGCDGIALLPGWNMSWGARLEAQVAMASGLRVFYLVEVGTEYEGHRLLHPDRLAVFIWP